MKELERSVGPQLQAIQQAIEDGKTPSTTDITCLVQSYTNLPAAVRKGLSASLKDRASGSAQLAPVVAIVNAIPPQNLPSLAVAGVQLFADFKASQVRKENEGPCGPNPKLAAAFIMEIQALPPGITNKMVAAVPDPAMQHMAKHVMQVCSGLETEDVEELVGQFNVQRGLKKDGTSSSKKPASGEDGHRKKLLASDNTSESKSDNSAAVDATVAEQDKDKDINPEDAQKEAMKSLVKTLARAEARRLWKWIKSSPFSQRALSFFCGFLLFGASLFGLIADLFTAHFLVRFCHRCHYSLSV
jgi:hypothetical protein